MTQQTFQAINPATGEALDGEVVEATAQDVDRAVTAASQAAQETFDLPPRWQAALLERTEAETALPRPRLIGERARTTGQLKMFAAIVREGSWVEAVIDTADPQRQPLAKPDLRRMLCPRGPVAVFGASNFPYAFGTVGGDTASALAAGCPVIVKGHPSHPGTSQLLAGAVTGAIQALKLPAGLFTLLQGRGHELSRALVTHPQITAVGFTGSLRAGRALFDLAAARPVPIPVFAEMGSTNPLFVLPGAIVERSEKIAQDLSASVLLGGGQFCTKPGLVFSVGDDRNFVSALKEKIAAQPAVTMLNQNLRENFCQRVGSFATVPGVKPIAQGQPTAHAGVSPSLFETDAVTWRREAKLREEAFGPATLIVHCRDLNEAVACVDALEGSLTGTVHLSDVDKPAAQQLLRRLEGKVGRVIVNGYPTGVEVGNAIVHGGPYPATTDPASTSVGAAAIRRWVRMIAFQDVPDELLPPALQDGNPLTIQRVINGERTNGPVPAAAKAS